MTCKKIKRIRPKKPIPLCVKEYGEPFLSKYVSEQIMRLQKHNFKWEDKPYEELIREYPKCKVALRWWCNAYEKDGKVIECSRFSIKRNKWLKEFIIKHPPDFPVSNKCCYYAKKSPVYVFLKEIGADLDITGIRKSEGGIRGTAYKNCLSIDKQKGCRAYRPIFWYNNSDKEYYEKRYDITHSRCYTEYGFKRTGCVGCPYNRKITEELSVIKEKKPKLYAAALSVFGRSYEYTRQYREFQREMNEQEREIKAAA